MLEPTVQDAARGVPQVAERAVIEALGPQGRLAQAIGAAYEERPQQLEMALRVHKAFASGTVLLVEAGTGTGKSLAYLVPAALWACQTGEPAVIATYTIHLQEQLLGREVPLASEAIGQPIRAAVLKGWSNYLCRLRVAQLVDQPALLDMGESRPLAAIQEWMRKTQTGSRSELGWEPPGGLWEKVAADPDSCLRSRCPLYSECFLFRSRREAAQAQLLLVNHHLLLADLSVRQSLGVDAPQAVLPRYRYLVVDEAHHLPAVAADQLGMAVSRLGLARLVGRLGGAGGRRRSQGSAPSPESAGRQSLIGVLRLRLLDGASAGAGAPEAFVLEQLEACAAGVARVELAGARLFDDIAAWVRRAGQRAEGDPSGTRTLRLSAPEDVPQPLREAASTLSSELEELSRRLREVESLARDAGLPEEEGLLAELGAAGNRAARVAGELAELLQPSDPQTAYWVEASETGQRCELRSAPLALSGEMPEALLSPLRGAVFTSATLTVGGRFDHLRADLGLEAREELKVEEVAIASPFDYRRQAVLMVPTDLPLPEEPHFAEALAGFLPQLLKLTAGRSFVLFTSYRLMREVAQRCGAELEGAGLTLLYQGEASREALLDRFRTLPGACLFGTDSFWEGVDVPGPALSCVVLTRIPFPVPSDPLVQARSEWLRAHGENPFLRLMLPRAVLRLKQGFGRLIRRAGDRGVVVLCDRRVLSRSYGATVIGSLPEVELRALSQERLLEEVPGWLPA